MDISISAVTLFGEKRFEQKVIRPREGKFRKLQVGNLISALSRLKITLSGRCVCLPDSSLIAKMDIAGYQSLNFKSYS